MPRVNVLAEPDVVAALRAAGCVFAEDEARLLVETAGTPGDLAGLVDERVRGTPLEHLLGWVEFFGLRFAVGPDVFVPRRRSEVLVREALVTARRGAVVVELCSGVAAVGAAIARTLGEADLHVVDIDATAVAYASRNVAPVDGRAYVGDLDGPLPDDLRGRVDVLVANAPYVPSDEIVFMPSEARDYEPAYALDGGSDGVDLHRRIAALSPDWLAPDGRLLIETSVRQAGLTTEAFVRGGLRTRTVHRDDVDGTAVVGSRQR